MSEHKKAVGEHAADRFIESGMRVGLGTGSTAVHFIRRLGERIADGDISDIRGVPTSSQSLLEARAAGIGVFDLDDPAVDGELDIAVDGADEVDPKRNLTKGGGGALLMEKIVAHASRRVVVICDEAKLVENLGIGFPIAVEVVREARLTVSRAIQRLGGGPQLRLAQRKMGAVITDGGHMILDVAFERPFDPVAMEAELNTIPGVVENGLFTRCNPHVIVARADGEFSEMKAAPRS
ncbi:MAG: ribose-5-phosphate isomerase RpiA [Spirochaetes bacterium]|nr:ribose-5-phosphate isomerase RpiA [Spirochaetota bacterium]